jgi:nucleoside-diphosphate-sugar epimerase
VKILMIGGTGQLGHFVLKHLADAGHELVAVGVGGAPEPGFLPDGTVLLDRDTNAASIEELAHLLHGVDAVIHAAGADGRNVFAPPAIDAFRAANVQPVERLVAAMRRCGSRKLAILGSYYTAMSRIYPKLALGDKSAYIASRLEQNRAAIAAAGDDVAVGVLELPYIFGAAPRRGTLWGFYIDQLRSGDGELPVHAGGSACVTMNQVGIAAAHLCEQLEDHRNYPICSENLKYADIFGIFAQHLGVSRTIVPREPAYFIEAASRQAEALRKNGKESAYDPIGLLEIENADLFIDPLPAMQALRFGPENISDAIRESIEATLRHAGKGPGSRDAA